MGDAVSIYLLVVAVGLGLFAVAIGGLVWLVRTGQLEDLDTPPLRMLHDDCPATPKESQHG
ncbi:MAG: cbb3-type cytochrome oxidase assembly protein [Planctomycetota bacterium]|jgi:cbb3-type cytochrome oxidase maturation protein|nr:cbb3-type cytochrome oxidase assembly protein [Planctomycetota bacterium]